MLTDFFKRFGYDGIDSISGFDDEGLVGTPSGRCGRGWEFVFEGAGEGPATCGRLKHGRYREVGDGSVGTDVESSQVSCEGFANVYNSKAIGEDE